MDTCAPPCNRRSHRDACTYVGAYIYIQIYSYNGIHAAEYVLQGGMENIQQKCKCMLTHTFMQYLFAIILQIRGCRYGRGCS